MMEGGGLMLASGVGSSRSGLRRGVGWVAVVASLLLGAGCGGDEGGDGGLLAREQRSTAERAVGGVVQVVMPGDVEVTLEPLAGAVGTETMHLALLGGGEVGEIGRGDAARQPADGERFVVVELEKRPLEFRNALTIREHDEMAQRGVATFAVQVDGGPVTGVNLDTPSYTPLPIDLDNPPVPPPPADPNLPQRRLLVVSAPEDAENVELVVTSQGLEQRLSLLTGQPGPGHVPVLARANRTMPTPPPPQEVSATVTEFGLSGSASQPVGIMAATLQLSAGVSDRRQVAGPGRAILAVLFDTFDFGYHLASELRLPDGTLVQPMPPLDEILAGSNPLIYFDVPADFTTGTVVFGKDYTWEVPSGGTIAANFESQVEYPIEIPLQAPVAPAAPPEEAASTGPGSGRVQLL
jgi:hypothetical protein